MEANNALAWTIKCSCLKSIEVLVYVRSTCGVHEPLIDLSLLAGSICWEGLTCSLCALYLKA